MRIVVTGLIAQHPHLGGVAWDYLQYPLGLARLGHDVYYLEDSGEWPYTVDGGPSGDQWIAHDCRPNVEHLARVMARCGLEDRWAYRFPIRPRWYGMPHRKRREVIATADLLLNVSGTLHRPNDYRSVKRLVYIDSDPVFTQVKLASPRGQGGFRERAAAHDVFASFGEALADAPADEVPATAYHWIPTRQPIVLEQWSTRDTAARPAFTTVMSWTSYRPLRYRGRTYAQKDVELRRFLDLPRRAPEAKFEIALAGTRHLNWESTAATDAGAAAGGESSPPDARTLLGSRGWHVIDAAAVSSDLDDYRRYVQSSLAEWSVAKNGYVRGRSGWFSCRSACYLAAGRPVVVEDTGFGAVLPTGEGILAFDSIEQAVDCVHDVTGNYSRHAAAARAIATEYFDSDRVLTRLLERATASPARADRPPPAGR